MLIYFDLLGHNSEVGLPVSTNEKSTTTTIYIKKGE